MTLARIIRAERRGPAVVRAEVHDAQLEAARVRARAREDAAQLLAAARASIERDRANGFAQGLAEGRAQAARELVGLAAIRDGALREREKEVRELALLLAAKLAGRAFEHDPQALDLLIEPLLARVRRARNVVLRVSPDAAAYVQSRVASMIEAVELSGTLEVVADPAIETGGCLIESSLGELDARLTTRVSELARALGWEPA
jgi:flagellar biosynthesis/type III secretory pathway protein FliH